MNCTMSTIIAKRELTRITQDGVQSLVEVNIGTPMLRQFEDGISDWYCPVQVLGIESDRVFPAFGTDSIQALYLALKLAGTLIATSPIAAEIVGSEDNYGFPATGSSLYRKTD